MGRQVVGWEVVWVGGLRGSAAPPTTQTVSEERCHEYNNHLHHLPSDEIQRVTVPTDAAATPKPCCLNGRAATRHNRRGYCRYAVVVCRQRAR